MTSFLVLTASFFSNGTYGAGGTANYESISSLLGMQTNSDGSICYVPERFPENWYRRATPYGVSQLIEGLAPTYLTGPGLTLPNPLGAVLQNPGQIPQIGCALYQGITSGVPASILGSTNEFASRATQLLQQKLAPILPVSRSLVLADGSRSTDVIPTSRLCRRPTRTVDSTAPMRSGRTTIISVDKQRHKR